jgi:glycosyltransferase involved in cell wall biosynthesis
MRNPSALSILTPSRNYERFVLDALHSVAIQSDTGIEHIVVDGASTDGTLPLLQRWGDRICYKSEPDLGQSDALNKAATMAKGEWLGWLNADEFYLPGAFETVRAVLHRDPSSDVIYGDCCFVDSNGRLLRLVPQHRFEPRILRWYGPFLSSCAVFIRTAALPRRGWDTSLRRIMDWDLYLELQRQGARFTHVTAPLAAFRVHDAQVTATPARSWEGEGARVRARHGLSVHPWPARTLRAVGLVQHGSRKLAEGAYQRQSAVRQVLRGADLRWFASPLGQLNAELLVRMASRAVWPAQ